jgi:putative endonuclease
MSTLWRRLESNKYHVYIMTSKRNGSLYVGSTSELKKRVYQHKNDLVEGFTKRYKIHMLVYFEEHADAYQAVTRERQIKKWKREWKLNVIEEFNPLWKDLYDEIY